MTVVRCSRREGCGNIQQRVRVFCDQNVSQVSVEFVKDQHRNSRVDWSLGRKDLFRYCRIWPKIVEKESSLTDQQWSRKVKKRYGNHCHWPGCRHVNTQIEAAHIVPRWDYTKRFDVSNGIPLCSVHHRNFDSMTLEKRTKFLKLVGREV